MICFWISLHSYQLNVFYFYAFIKWIITQRYFWVLQPNMTASLIRGLNDCCTVLVIQLPVATRFRPVLTVAVPRLVTVCFFSFDENTQHLLRLCRLIYIQTGDQSHGGDWTTVWEVTALKVGHQEAWSRRKCMWWDQLSLKLPSICFHYGNRVWVMALTLTLPLISREMATVNHIWRNTHMGAKNTHSSHTEEYKHPAATQANWFYKQSKNMFRDS